MLYPGSQRFSLIFSVLKGFYYLFLALLGLRCCAGFSLVVASGGNFLVAVCRLLIAVASLVAEQRLWGSWASVVAAHGLSSWGSQTLEHRLSSAVHGLSCSAACGIFPDRGSKLCLLHWQVDSLPLSHQRSPLIFSFLKVYSFSVVHLNP